MNIMRFLKKYRVLILIILFIIALYYLTNFNFTSQSFFGDGGSASAVGG